MERRACTAWTLGWVHALGEAQQDLATKTRISLPASTLMPEVQADTLPNQTFPTHTTPQRASSSGSHQAQRKARPPPRPFPSVSKVLLPSHVPIPPPPLSHPPRRSPLPAKARNPSVLPRLAEGACKPPSTSTNRHTPSSTWTTIGNE